MNPEEAAPEVGSSVQPGFIVLFDADVLFRAAVFRFLLGAAQAGFYRARWTTRIVDEARVGLIRANRQASLRALEQNLQLIPDPLVRGFDDLERQFPRTEPRDRHVAAATLRAGAQYLVTGNVRHFDAQEAAEHGFQVLGYDTFGLFVAENPKGLAALARHIQRQPRHRLRLYLERLEVEMPRTARIIQPLFAADLADESTDCRPGP